MDLEELIALVKKLIVSESYSAVLDLLPDKKLSQLNNQGLYFYSGYAKSKLGLLKEAIEDFNKAIELNPQFAEAYNYRGAAKGELGLLKEAIEDFNKAIELNPQFAEAYNYRGAAKGELGLFKEAIEDYNKAIEANPQFAEAYRNRGAAKDKLGLFKEVIEDFNKAIELNPHDAEAYRDRGAAKNNLRLFNEAIEDYNKAIELNPQDGVAYHNRGVAKHRLGLFKEAIEDYNKAIGLNPQFAKAYYYRGVAKGKLGLFKEAIEDYNKAIVLNPQDAEAYYNRGASKHRLGLFKEAIEDYNKAIELNPQDEVAYHNRGVAKHRLELFKEAIEDFNKAIGLNPQFAKAYYYRGAAKGELGLFKEAIEDYNKAIVLNPQFAKAYFSLGVEKNSLGLFKEAIEDYNKAIELNQQDGVAYHNRGVAKAKLGLFKEAMVDYNKAIELNPQFAEAYFSLGLEKGTLGLFKEAIEDYNKAIALNQQFAEAYHNRGVAKGILGLFKEAIEDYNKATQINLKFPLPHLGLSYIPQGYSIGAHERQQHLLRYFYLEKEIVPFICITHSLSFDAPLLSYNMFLQCGINLHEIKTSFGLLEAIRHVTPFLSLFEEWAKLYKEQYPELYKRALELEAIISYYLGNPIHSYKIITEELDLPGNTISLKVQYYLVNACIAFIEPHKSILLDAIEQANSAIQDQSATNEDLYYAGLIYLLAEEENNKEPNYPIGYFAEKAREVLNSLVADEKMFFPAYLALKGYEYERTVDKLVVEEALKLKDRKLEEYIYPKPITLVKDIVLASADIQHIFYLAENYTFLSELLIQDNENRVTHEINNLTDFLFDKIVVIDLSDEALKKVREKNLQKALEKIKPEHMLSSEYIAAQLSLAKDKGQKLDKYIGNEVYKIVGAVLNRNTKYEKIEEFWKDFNKFYLLALKAPVEKDVDLQLYNRLANYMQECRVLIVGKHSELLEYLEEEGRDQLNEMINEMLDLANNFKYVTEITGVHIGFGSAMRIGSLIYKKITKETQLLTFEDYLDLLNSAEKTKDDEKPNSGSQI